MSILRQMKCDIKGCNETMTEPNSTQGWIGWGQILGIQIEGMSDTAEMGFCLCPEHLTNIAIYVQELEVK